ncbi:hypothetical protein C6558_03410 [Ensifer sp. NM-2]|uniref:hypothetical protein n=1 Tax=Ensifer sp. NM-2 TaxID=2109730 RepID=UPI000D12EE01|nr:hypothetical protein [Ensifer sp. NM-2]PSS67073.1 hypothetical protein C6558_03410 [Ensifer sp. NM-2]
MNASRIQRADEPKSKVKLSAIRTDGGTQSRATVSDVVVDDYAAAMTDGATFPKMIIFYDGSEHWLADGFHRHRAYLKAGLTIVEADVRQGTRRDAVLFSVGANSSHGLQRTRDDKRRAVMTLLDDAEWSSWPNTKVAKACGVSEGFVRHLRIYEDIPTSDVRTVERNGTTYTMNTSAIGSGVLQFEQPENLVSQRVVLSQSEAIATQTAEDEITAEDLENDSGFQKAAEAFASAKALYDEAMAAPAAEPISPEREANLRRVLGTQEQRSTLLRVVNMAKAVADLPKPGDMVSAVPPALNHTIDVLSLLAAANWFEQFARAWERNPGAKA